MGAGIKNTVYRFILTRQTSIAVTAHRALSGQWYGRWRQLPTLQCFPRGLNRNTCLARHTDLTQAASISVEGITFFNMRSGTHQMLPAFFFVVAGCGNCAGRAAVNASAARPVSKIEAIGPMVGIWPGRRFDRQFGHNRPDPHGFALGGGLELAMSCHIRVASQTARMGLPEVSLGLIPGYGGTQRLPQLVGKGKAFEMIMTAGMIGAADALKWGLVNHLAEPDDLIEFSYQLAEKILANSSQAIKAAIGAVNAGFREGTDGGRVES